MNHILLQNVEKIIMSTENEIRARIISEGMKYLHLPYEHQTYGPKKFDCIGLVIRAGVDAEVLEWDVTNPKWEKYKGYSYEVDPKLFADGLASYLVKLAVRSEGGIGDIIWVREPDQPRHVGIITRLQPYMCILHAAYHNKKVMHEQIRNPGNIKAVWRYPGLQDVIDE